MPDPTTAPPTDAAAAEAAVQGLPARHGHAARAWVQILRDVQALHGWVPRESPRQLANALGLTPGRGQGVAGFYPFFHQQPVGCCRVLCSNNVTDRMRVSEKLMAHLRLAFEDVLSVDACVVVNRSRGMFGVAGVAGATGGRPTRAASAPEFAVPNRG